MKNSVQELVEISKFYGKQKEYVIAGGGNTSWKDDKHLYIKASGVSLATIDENGFCILDREKLDQITMMDFSADPVIREEEVKNALLNSRINPESGLRPSVETSLHNLFAYSFVVHTHPTLVNALMCSQNAEVKTKELFGNNALYIPYSDPGFILFKIIREKIFEYHQQEGNDPQVVFIQNHGVFVAANSVDEIQGLYSGIFLKIKSAVNDLPDINPKVLSDELLRVIPAARMILSDEKIKVARAFNNPLLQHFASGKVAFSKVKHPFTPDQMVYCLSEYLFIDDITSEETIISEVQKKARDFFNRKGTMPKVIFVKNEGVIVVDDSAIALDYLHDLVLDFTQIAYMSESFGGPHPMTPDQVTFIENWEVENYRKKVSLGAKAKGRVDGKVVVITGAAQGFGAGIAELMFNEGANLVIADLNRERGLEFTVQLNARNKMNRACFVSVNVSEADSVKQMVRETVTHFGGIDIMISNAGILRAGSLDEMTPETFDLMTRVNYNAYFYCAKYAGNVMKLQHQYKTGYFMDIIQINSKSGLKGSNKNFAYAGGKFGGIGLTQSFALELMPFNIKVNSICPGNFFDGPLWSDPENGLFVQYLNTGKIPGAKTIGDVKRHYESQVPAGRGCIASDVVKAIYYVIEQEYETGQAVPVTGGQEMLR
jgi:NAD(P)-dependent dehydrogenase (short-subunit alcohol dehydrogenase family)/rhamnose utilization protein RhaD (predicted bifunctional aldolase and dehydrogenase)